MAQGFELVGRPMTEVERTRFAHFERISSMGDVMEMHEHRRTNGLQDSGIRRAAIAWAC